MKGLLIKFTVLLFGSLTVCVFPSTAEQKRFTGAPRNIRSGNYTGELSVPLDKSSQRTYVNVDPKCAGLVNSIKSGKTTAVLTLNVSRKKASLEYKISGDFTEIGSASSKFNKFNNATNMGFALRDRKLILPGRKISDVLRITSHRNKDPEVSLLIAETLGSEESMNDTCFVGFTGKLRRNSL